MVLCHAKLWINSRSVREYSGVAVDFGVNRPEFYAALAEAFLTDKDGPGPEAKLCAYYRGIVERGR